MPNEEILTVKPSRKTRFTLLLLPLFSPAFLLILLPNTGYSNETLTLQPSLRIEQIKADGEVFVEPSVSAAFDNSGFLWLATDKGLLRYDGYTIKRFDETISDNQVGETHSISMVIKGSDGILWVACQAGLKRFDPNTAQFTPFVTSSGITHPFAGDVYHLFEDRFNHIWVSTAGGGLYQIKPDSAELVNYRPQQGNNASLSHTTVRKVVADPRGNLWIATNLGLNYFDRTSGLFKRFVHTPGDPQSLSHNTVRELYYDNNGTFWIGTTSGLNRFNPATGLFERFYPNPNKTNHNEDNNLINAIHQDKLGVIWLGTKSGIKQFDPGTRQFINHRKDITEPFSLKNDKIFPQGIIEDNQGLLWLSTYRGIQRFNPYAVAFNHYRHQPGNPNSPGGDQIWTAHEDNAGRLWLGTDKNGLSVFNPNTGHYRHIKHFDDDANSLVSNRVFAILVDSDNDLWVGTDRGLDRLRKDSGGFEHFQHDRLNSHSPNSNFIFELVEDSNGNIIIGTDDGLSKFDKTLNTIQRFGSHQNNDDNFTTASINKLYIDARQRLWVGTATGLHLYDDKNDHFHHFSHDFTTANRNNENNVRSIHLDSQGKLWVGSSGGGLNSFDLASGQFSHYGLNSPHAKAVIFSILEDNQGLLWLATRTGLLRYDPAKDHFEHFDAQDGVYERFIQWTSIKRRNGEMVLTGSDGINRFDPDKIIKHSTPPTVVLTDFLTFNRSVPVNPNGQQPSTARFSLDRSINSTNELALDYLMSDFAFEFAALDYLKPGKNRYAYQLQGVDEDWIYASANKRFASYRNIPSGHYRFRVKASNKNGLWHERERSLTVIINPPWWQTRLAYGCYLLALVVLLYLIDRRRSRLLRNIAEQLEVKISERTSQLAEQKDQYAQLLASKDNLFVNISHELRTPLAVIGNVCNNLLDFDLNPAVNNELVSGLRSYNDISRRVEQILLLSRAQNLPQMALTAINLSYMVKSVAASCRSLIAQRQLTLELDVDADLGIKSDVDSVETIVSNILTNAIKYTNSGGHIRVSLKLDEESVVFEVSDNGIGIAAEDLDIIFDRYARASKSTNEQKTMHSSGLGLSTVKDLLDVLGGKVSVSSEPNKGSTFTVSLKACLLEPGQGKYIINHLMMEKDINSVKDSYSRLEQAQAVYQPKDLQTNEQNKPIILVAEDNVDLAMSLQTRLEMHFFVVVVQNGAEAVKQSLILMPDLIICDVMMPKMDGYQVTHSVKNHQCTSHIPLILLTALGDKKSRIKGYQALADDYITKPFDMEELIVRINNLLSIRDLLRKRFAQQLNEQNSPNPPAPSPEELKEKAFLARLEEIIATIYDNSETKIAEISKAMAMSERQLFRKLTSIVDMTPTEYLRNYRLQKAAELLLEGEAASNISMAVGFGSHSYFSRAFKAKYGVPPSAYLGHFSEQSDFVGSVGVRGEVSENVADGV